MKHVAFHLAARTVSRGGILNWKVLVFFIPYDPKEANSSIVLEGEWGGGGKKS